VPSDLRSEGAGYFEPIYVTRYRVATYELSRGYREVRSPWLL